MFRFFHVWVEPQLNHLFKKVLFSLKVYAKIRLKKFHPFLIIVFTKTRQKHSIEKLLSLLYRSPNVTDKETLPWNLY